MCENVLIKHGSHKNIEFYCEHSCVLWACPLILWRNIILLNSSYIYLVQLVKVYFLFQRDFYVVTDVKS